VTDLTRLDGPGAAAVSDQLVATYRAAMGAAPFHETEVETGWFADELAEEVEEDGYRCWVATEDGRVVGFAYGLPTPEIPTGGWYGLVREAVRPAAAERWLAGQFAVVWASRSWAAAPSAGTTPSGWSWAPNSKRAGLNPTRRHQVPRWGRLPRQRDERAELSTGPVPSRDEGAEPSTGRVPSPG
jgi:hypothetical protein